MFYLCKWTIVCNKKNDYYETDGYSAVNSNPLIIIIST